MAMDLTAVQEVIEVPPLSRIPRPAGAADRFAVVRGRVLLVVDLRKRLGLVNPGMDQQTRLIVTAGHSRPWAFVVDTATEILSLGAGAFEGQGTPGAGFRSELFAGSLEVRGSRVLLPDFARLLGNP
jgi:purine-binding chemotaxis protein CheW